MSAIPLHTDFPEAAAQGWTPERKVRFLDCLAAKGNVRHACRRVGLSPEAAYRLRRREPLFARGWAAALVKAREVTEDVIAERAIDGVEEKVYFRGELVDTRRRYDTRLLLAHMARLDQLADERTAGADAGRFDELLACIGGEGVPADLESGKDVLPVDRETAAEEAAQQAEQGARRAEPDAGDRDDPAAFDAFEDACFAAAERGKVRGEARWDVWFDNACGFVDWASGWSDTPPAPGLPGRPLPQALETAVAAATESAVKPACFSPRTASTPSTSALARVLAGPVRGFTLTPRSPFAEGRGGAKGSRLSPAAQTRRASSR